MMKAKVTLLLFVLIPFFGIKAQQPITLSEDSLQIGKSVLPSISVTIPEADYDKTLKAWIRELQSGTRSKVVTENSEMSIFGAKIKSISSNPINVYSKLDRQESQLLLSASFETKKDEYATGSAGVPEYTKALDFMKEFSKTQYIEFAKEQADAEEKKLKDLEKELSSLENEKSRMEKSIESGRSTIQSENENITLMNSELATVNTSLQGQDTLLSTMEAGTARTELEKQVKELDKRKKKSLSSIESSEKKIQRANDDIDKATKAIPENEKMQLKVREQIAAQQAVYQQFAEKLKTIRAY